jgi:hypothetical protein
VSVSKRISKAVGLLATDEELRDPEMKRLVTGLATMKLALAPAHTIKAAHPEYRESVEAWLRLHYDVQNDLARRVNERRAYQRSRDAVTA